MNRQKRQKIAITSKLYHKDSVWFVYYSCRNPKSGKMERFKHYEGFKKLPDDPARMNHAQKLISDINRKITTGWSPFKDGGVIYEDHLVYQKVAKEYGKKRRTNKTFRFLMSRFLENKKPTISPATYTSYKSKFRVFDEFLVASGYQDNDVCFFSDKEAGQFIAWLSTHRKCAATTVNGYIVTFKSLFNKFLENEDVTDNPFFKIKPLRSARTSAKPFNPVQIKQLIGMISREEPQLYLVIRLIFNCFIRPKEIRLLKVKDIDFSSGIITVNSTVSKNKKKRIVDIPEYLFKDLMRSKYNECNPEYFLISNTGYPSSSRDPVGKNYMYNRFERYRRRLKLPREHKFYGWKHTGVKMLVEKRVDWLELKNQLGHHSLDQVVEYATSLLGKRSEFIRKKGPKI